MVDGLGCMLAGRTLHTIYPKQTGTVSIQLLPDTSIARPQLLPEPES